MKSSRLCGIVRFNRMLVCCRAVIHAVVTRKITSSKLLHCLAGICMKGIFLLNEDGVKASSPTRHGKLFKLWNTTALILEVQLLMKPTPVGFAQFLMM